MLLLVRWSGALRWVAGMLAMEFGCLERASGRRGGEFEVGVDFWSVGGVTVCSGVYSLWEMAGLEVRCFRKVEVQRISGWSLEGSSGLEWREL